MTPATFRGQRSSAGWRFIVSAAVLAFVFLFPQDRAEAQTAADSAAVLLEAAERFEGRGRTDVADALRGMILERFPGTFAAAEVRRLREVRPVVAEDRSGAVELRVWSTLYGAWLGIAIPMIADADGPEAHGIGLLLGAPAGFFAARAYGRSRPLSEGQARAITWGGTWGTWQGFGWAKVLDLGVETVRECPDPAIPCYDLRVDNGTQETVGAMVAGGLTGIIVGGVLSRKPIPASQATIVNFGSLWGTWFGFTGSYLADLEDDALLAGTLVGGNAGLVASALLGPGWNLSQSRARLISIAGVAGGLAGGGVDLIIQPENGKVGVAIPLAGSIAGLTLGALLTRPDPVRAAGPDESPETAGALLRRDAGEWSFDLPTPVPTFVRDERAGDGVLRPAVTLRLLDARF